MELHIIRGIHVLLALALFFLLYSRPEAAARREARRSLKRAEQKLSLVQEARERRTSQYSNHLHVAMKQRGVISSSGGYSSTLEKMFLEALGRNGPIVSSPWYKALEPKDAFQYEVEDEHTLLEGEYGNPDNSW